MVRINWTIQARDDLKNISDYIAQDSVKYAKLQVVRIKTRTKVLYDHIRIGKVVPEFNDPIIRELIEGNYRIIYKITSETRVDILTIHHVARKL